MTLIEGIGDEVVDFFIGLLITCIGIIAWWSTRIADRPLIRTVLVFERRSQTHVTNSTSIQNTSEERRAIDQRDYVQDLATVPVQTVENQRELEENKPPEAGSSVEVDRGRSPNTSGAGDADQLYSENSRIDEEQREILESMDSEEACVLRRRRLDFFQNRQEPFLANSSPVLDSDLDRDINNSTTNVIHNDKIENADNDMNNLQDADNASRTDSTDTIETTIEEDDIRIKLKYINDDLKLVNGKLQEPLGDFKRRHFEFELANDKLVRLIFNGQVLQRDDLTLQSCGFFDNCVVHCLVHQKKQSGNDRSTSGNNTHSGNATTAGGSATDGGIGRTRMTSNVHNAGREWDLGNLFFAIVSFVLGAAWYFRYEYSQLYTVTATVALVGLTGIFTVLLIGMYFPDPEAPVQPVRT